MKRIILASILVITFLLAFAAISNAEMAKEGSLSDTVTYAGTHKIIPLD